jgi:hypothetical protein
MGSLALGAFDGSAWRTVLVPPQCGPGLEALASAEPDVVYAMVLRDTAASAHRICRVSSNLSSWTPMGDFAARAPSSLVATRAGTVLATGVSYVAEGSQLAIARAGASVGLCAGPFLDHSHVIWVAPESHNVHIFSAQQANAPQPGRHWLGRLDP